jgi:hypothetical protein
MNPRFIKNIALFFILLFLIACEKSPNNPEAIFTVTGFVYEAETNPPVPIVGAKVLVGDVYGISDSTGYFVVNDILGRKGTDNEYVFTVTHQIYETLRQTINMRSDMMVNFFLRRKAVIFTLTGFVYEADTNPPTPVANAKVMVGDVYDFSDSTGHFTVDDILGREGVDNVYLFRVFHETCDSLKETVIMRSDTTHDFFMVKKVDFFPVAPGNYWKYDYYFEIKTMVSYGFFAGQITWEMIFEEGEVYIRETQNGIEYNTETERDTVYINNRIVNCSFLSSPRVYISRPYWNGYPEGSSAPMDYNRIDRFQSPTIGDTLHINKKLNYDQYYKADFVKNIGLVSWDWYGPVYHAVIKEKANLIEYHINK